jgi:ATP-binding cassette, subfamily B, multidrug efflux pump
LFSDTIRSNLEYGLDAEPTADSSRTLPRANARGLEQGESAARVAQLTDTINAFPGGYETLLGERGINLSGGQKQRVALARALARSPCVVLLDDALSAVDTHTEAEILRELRSAVTGRTAVIASHRVSAIRDASWIIVLDEGRIVEQGRHDGLIARGGRYWSLLSRQQLEASIEADGELATAGSAGTLEP